MGSGTHVVNGTNRPLGKGLVVRSRVTSGGGFALEIVSTRCSGGKMFKKCTTVDPIPCEELIY